MIAVVAGYAIGGGHVLHVVCDLTIAADNARFGQTGPKVGSFDGGFGAGHLARIVGPEEGPRDRVPLSPVRRPGGAEWASSTPWSRWSNWRTRRSVARRCFSSGLSLPPQVGLQRRQDGLAGIQELAHNATLAYYGSDEAQEGRNAYNEKRRPDFSKFPRLP